MTDLHVFGLVVALLLLATAALLAWRQKGRESKEVKAPEEAREKLQESPPASSAADPVIEPTAQAAGRALEPMTEVERVEILTEEPAPPRSPAVTEEPTEVSIETTEAPEPVELKSTASEPTASESTAPEFAAKSLDQALEKTRQGFFGRIKGLFGGGQSFGDEELEELEEILYTSDLGPATVQRLMEGLDERLSRRERKDFETVREALREEMIAIFSGTDQEDPFEQWEQTSSEGPTVLMIVGVNGAGKTTTIGKLARHFSLSGKKVLIAAGDTFRAAAEEQLKVWTERAEVEIFSPEGVDDPSAVAFDACQQAVSQSFDTLIVDTAGRLHTQKNLMEELKKMRRVVDKKIAGAPHEILLVLDANSGQNALIQAKSFHDALGVTGVILTKMDGTAKGGVAVGVACELQLPIRLIGVGEGLHDLRRFSSTDFVDSIL